MSNGLADASFFPTAKELSTGLRWFKDHPVLAAAAATAVSVITYLNATDALAPTECDRPDDDEEEDGDEASADEEEEYYIRHSSSSNRSRRRDADDDGDGKLSAAVSWGDECGGSLTQVFEHRDASDEEPARPSHCSNSSEGGGSRSGALAAAATRPLDDGARPVGAIRKSSTQRSIVGGVSSPDVTAPGAPCRVRALRDDEGHVTISPGGEIDLQTESPQWGWYVAITPPQDHMHASLPRVALLPPPPPRTHNYSGGIARPSPVPVAATSTLRRSTSGRIS